MAKRSWLDIRTNGAKYQTEMKRMQASVTNAPNQILKGYYADVHKIVWDGARYGRQLILNDTNTVKYRTTGKKGRIDTGDMAASFWANARKDGDKRYKLNVGWLSGKPGYAIFQEYGTSRGLAGVEALRQSQEYIDREVRKLKAGGRNYLTKTSGAMKNSGMDRQRNEEPPAWFKGR